MTTLRTTAVLSAAAAGLGSLGVRNETFWYEELTKPRGNPPDWVYPVVWTPIYGTIAWATARMIEAEPDEDERRRLWALVTVDLGLNAACCWAFFHRESFATGIATSTSLSVTNLVLAREAWRRDRVAAAALAPYLVWAAVSDALQVAFWRSNRVRRTRRVLAAVDRAFVRPFRGR